MRRSNTTPSDKPPSKARLIASVPASTEGSDMLAMVSATFIASSIRFAAGTTRATSPDFSASAASIMRPVKIISIALALPTARVSRWVPPIPGMTPSLISGWPNLALSAAMMTSHCMASSQPPPSAKPATASIEPYLYRHEGQNAIHHLFRVASSLDSMVVGEPQILGQLKTAYGIAKTQGALCGWLEGLLERAFSVAKRVRSETGIGQMAVSVSYAAVELARKIFGSLNNRTVMIAGAGKMSELAARHLRRAGATHVFVTNRTHERAIEMAKLFQGTPVEYSRFVAMLPEVDILIASSGAPHYILHKDEMQRVLSARRNKPMFLIDIAVPRNIEPSVNDLDNVFLYDIDDLQEVVNSNLRERMKEADHAEALVSEEVERM